ncbi:MAG: hypothetical protein AB7K52_05550 [Phycisphaerales bacterium]
MIKRLAHGLIPSVQTTEDRSKNRREDMSQIVTLTVTRQRILLLALLSFAAMC